MTSIDASAASFLAHGWQLLLAFTVATLCAALLRRPCRRWFGARRACQLWLLPLLAMLASQWPHFATGVDAGAPLPALVYLLTSAAVMPSAHGGVATIHGWRSAVMCLWVLGIVLVCFRAMLAQRRYRERLHDATPVTGGSTSAPLLRAAQPDVGPALVGAWRPRIVVPADFERRYDVVERALILAHERMHARRRDGLASLVAQIVVSVLWFHPLAWWALGALRHDQELACDAAVLLEHRADRRAYANAMLKTQPSANQLPVGCSWSPRHPITERIAMLKQLPPSRLQSRLGLLAGVLLCTVVSGVVYAASRPTSAAAAMSSPAVASHEYQLDIMVASFANGSHADHAERTTVGLCMKAGEPGSVNTGHGWQLQARVTPAGADQVRLALALSDAAGKPLASRALKGQLGQPLLAEFDGADVAHSYSIDVTPLAGCPARTGDNGAAARLTMIKDSVKNQPVRSVIESMAQRAGLEVANPQDLSTNLVTLNFDQIPAERALQLLADIDGKKAVFEGKQVRFDTK